nr:MAG TPA: hypothetical protein [Caudoviricetes sp.]
MRCYRWENTIQNASTKKDRRCIKRCITLS